MKAHKLRPGHIVECDDWNDGQPVRVQDAHLSSDGVGVRYQDVNAHSNAQQVTVKPGNKITHKSGTRRGQR